MVSPRCRRCRGPADDGGGDGGVCAGVNFMEKTISIRGSEITFSIWDLGGTFVTHDGRSVFFFSIASASQRAWLAHGRSCISVERASTMLLFRSVASCADGCADVRWDAFRTCRPEGVCQHAAAGVQRRGGDSLYVRFVTETDAVSALRRRPLSSLARFRSLLRCSALRSSLTVLPAQIQREGVVPSGAGL
jgi:hypothetical protein